MLFSNKDKGINKKELEILSDIEKDINNFRENIKNLANLNIYELKNIRSFDELDYNVKEFLRLLDSLEILINIINKIKDYSELFFNELKLSQLINYDEKIKRLYPIIIRLDELNKKLNRVSMDLYFTLERLKSI